MFHGFSSVWQQNSLFLFLSSHIELLYYYCYYCCYYFAITTTLLPIFPIGFPVRTVFFFPVFVSFLMFFSAGLQPFVLSLFSIIYYIIYYMLYFLITCFDSIFIIFVLSLRILAVFMCYTTDYII